MKSYKKLEEVKQMNLYQHFQHKFTLPDLMISYPKFSHKKEAIKDPFNKDPKCQLTLNLIWKNQSYIGRFLI